MQDLTAARLRELLLYDPLTGEWTWLQTRGRNVPEGSRAGADRGGYRYIQVDGNHYASSRIAFLFMTGKFPADFVDHKNLNRSDDRWENLREATKAENGANRPLNRNSSSGFKGVSWDKGCNKWSAKIGFGGRKHHLGVFDAPEDAYAAYLLAAQKRHGQFARAS